MPARIERAPAFAPGDVFHQFTIVELLGEGLHGEVYRVEHRHTGKCFALKVLRLEDSRDASKVRRCMTTAKASYRIDHANVVTVHDLGCEDDGRVWVLMELLEGCSIGSLLARLGGRLSVPLALHVAIEAAWGLDAAHELQIIHRDVKPDNTWLTLEGVVKVLDWSLAKVIPEGVRTTQRTNGVGTAPYMAPECFKGGAPDARMDIYALAMMLYQSIVGRHPFEDAMRSTDEMLRRQIFVEPEPLSIAARLPAYVDDFMRRALAKDPAKRFFTMAEMARAAMTLRDRLRADAEAGLLEIDAPEGEPPLPGDPWARRAYQPPRALPPATLPDEAPTDRVVVPAIGTSPLKDTLPMPGMVGPKGTLPLDDVELAAAVKRLPLPPAWTPASRASAPVALPVPKRSAPVRLVVAAAFALLAAVGASLAVLVWPRASAGAHGPVVAQAPAVSEPPSAPSPEIAAPPPVETAVLPAPTAAPLVTAVPQAVRVPARSPKPLMAAPMPTVPVAPTAPAAPVGVPLQPAATAPHRMFGLDP